MLSQDFLNFNVDMNYLEDLSEIQSMWGKT